MGLRLAIFLLSAAALAYEILLIRLLAIVQWHHFAYLVISLALLGYGASGTFLSLARAHLLRRFEAAFLAGTVSFALLVPVCFAAAQWLRFNPLEIVWNPGQLGYLLLLQLLLAVPFFAAATCIGLSFMRFDGEIHRLYRADLLGAGAGAGLILLALLYRRPGECLFLISAIALLAAAAACMDRQLSIARSLSVVFAVAGLVAGAWRGDGLDLRMSEYKELEKALQVPQSRVLLERSSPLGLISVLESRQIPLRQAPGMSLSFSEELPEQLGIFGDGNSMAAINRLAEGPGRLEYLDYLPSAVPYELLSRPRVAVLGAAGGSEVLLALQHGASRVDLVEHNPQILDLLLKDFRDFSGDPYRHPQVHLHIADARGYFARSREKFDLIQIAFFDPGGGDAGMYALSESYFYTVESFEELVASLSDGGFLAMTRWLKLPPRDSLKLVAIAVEVLEGIGVANPGNSLVLMRSWDAVILLVKKGEFAQGEVATLKRVCQERSFDLAYYPGMASAEANRFNILEQPYFFNGVTALLGSGRQEFLDGYKFRLDPATDDRPYFYRFFKWSALPELYRLRVQGGPGLIEWGYILLIAALIEAALIGFILILVPLGLFGRRVSGKPDRRVGAVPISLYFLSLGLAFLFMEIAFIQRFVLFLAHPIYAVAVVVAAFLVFAGLGSGLSARWAGWWRSKRLPNRTDGLSPIDAAAVGIAAIGALYLVALPSLLSRWVGWTLPVKIVVAVILIAPLAFLMGMPFPLGLERVAVVHKQWIPWAWGINGWASVLSALLAVLIAIHLGFSAVVAAACLLYLAAAVASRGLGEGGRTKVGAGR